MKLTAPRRALARATAALVLTLGLAGTSTGLLTGAEAHAQPVTEGTFSFSGDTGDYISGGDSYSYSTESQDQLTVSASSDDRVLSLSVDGANGDWWYLDLAAPSGASLTPGTYTGATRYPFNGSAEPGLSLSGNGRGCNTLTGEFTIADVEFGPEGYVQTLDATFEQHCEGGTAAARGEVHISNPAPPEQLDLGLAVAVDGTASSLNGNASLHGTVTCNKPVHVTVSGQVTEVKHRVIIRGSYSTSVDCAPDAPAAWNATAVPDGSTPFQHGDVEVRGHARAIDPDYGQSVTVDETVTVRLKHG